MNVVSIKDIYDFKACPARYQLTKAGKVTHKAEKDIVRETVLSVISYYYLQLQDGHIMSKEEIRKRTSRAIANLEDYSLLDPKNKKQRERELKIIKLIDTFYNHEKNVDQKVIAVNLEFLMNFSKTIGVRDSIPLIRKVRENETELVIFKTGRNYVNTFWLETDISISLYAMAFQNMFQKQIDNICVYHIPSSSIYYTKRKPKNYKRLIKSVRLLDEAVEKSGFYTRESMLCESCPARFSCLEHY